MGPYGYLIIVILAVLALAFAITSLLTAFPNIAMISLWPAWYGARSFLTDEMLQIHLLMLVGLICICLLYVSKPRNFPGASSERNNNANNIA